MECYSGSSIVGAIFGTIIAIVLLGVLAWWIYKKYYCKHLKGKRTLNGKKNSHTWLLVKYQSWLRNNRTKKVHWWDFLVGVSVLLQSISNAIRQSQLSCIDFLLLWCGSFLNLSSPASEPFRIRGRHPTACDIICGYSESIDFFAKTCFHNLRLSLSAQL